MAFPATTGSTHKARALSSGIGWSSQGTPVETQDASTFLEAQSFVEKVEPEENQDSGGKKEEDLPLGLPTAVSRATDTIAKWAATPCSGE